MILVRQHLENVMVTILDSIGIYTNIEIVWVLSVMQYLLLDRLRVWVGWVDPNFCGKPFVESIPIYGLDSLCPGRPTTKHTTIIKDFFVHHKILLINH